MIRADDSPIAQDGHFICDSEHFVDAVRDVDDRLPASLQIVHDPEKMMHLALGQGRRRLVHDEHVRLIRHRARDLDHLSVWAIVRSETRSSGSISIVELGEQARRPPRERTMIDEPQPRQRLPADPDVLGHRHGRHEMQLLMNHGGAAAKRRRCRESGRMWPAMIFISVDFPAPFSPISACTLPARTLQRHLIQRENAWERLAHAVHFEQRVHGAGIH